jgi:hypothetical protein
MTMNDQYRGYSITMLRLVVGLVILQQSCALAFSSNAAAAFAHTGWPNGLRLILAWTEIAGAILFLIPATVTSGAGLLLAILLGAVTLHVTHGEFQVGGLLIYAVAVFVVLAHRRPKSASPLPERGAQ